MKYIPNRIGKSLRSAHDFKIKPPFWGGFSPALIAPEWQWFWQGLIAVYPMWEGVGDTIYDYSNNGHHGTFVQNGGTLPTWEMTEWGVSVKTYTDNSYIRLGTVSRFFPEADSQQIYTLHVMATLPSSNGGTLFSEGVDNPASTNYRNWFGVNTDGSFTADDNPPSGGLRSSTLSGGSGANLYSTRRDQRVTTQHHFINGLPAGTFTSVENPGANSYTGVVIGKRSVQSDFNQLGSNLLFFSLHSDLHTDAQISQLGVDPFGPLRMHDVRAK